MAGHSKWSNIKHKKKIKDQKKSKKISKIISNIKNSLKDQKNTMNNSKIKNAINIAKENNINKKIINNLLKQDNINSNTINLAFENNDMFLILETINDQEIISNIKYTLSTLFFKTISIERISENIITYSIIKIKNHYNEIDILNKLMKKTNLINTINDSIIINDKNNIKALITKEFNLEIGDMIVFKKKITIEEKKKHKLSLTLTKLLQSNNIKNVFNNIDTLAFN